MVFAPGDMLVNMLHGKKDFAVVIKVTNQQTKVDYPELSGQPNEVTNFSKQSFVLAEGRS